MACRFFRKTLSLFLALLFIQGHFCVLGSQPDFSLLSSISFQTYPVTLNKINKTLELTVPSRLGHVEERFKGDADQLVIMIQDPHCVIDAQRNEVELLKFLIKQNISLGFIAVEGAQGEINLSLLKSIRNAEQKEVIASYLLKKSLIKGSEFFSSCQKQILPLIGVEDPDAYFKSLKLFQESHNQKSKILHELQSYENILENLKSKILSKKLIHLLDEDKKYREGNLSFEDYTKLLKEEAIQENMTLDSYISFLCFLQTLELAQTLDQEKVHQEEQALVKHLTEKLSREDLALMIEKSLAFRLGKIRAEEFFSYLESLTLKGGVTLQDFPRLQKYREFIHHKNKINQTELWQNIQSVLEELKSRMGSSADAREYLKLADDLRLLQNLSELQLTKREWQKYRSEIENFRKMEERIKNFLDAHGIRLEGHSFRKMFLSCESFYQETTKRDQILFDNTFKELQKRDAKACALIVGGFHIDGLKQLFQKKGISYVVLTPTTKNINSSNYIDLLLAKRTSLDFFLERNVHHLDVMSTFPNGLIDGLREGAAPAALEALIPKLEHKYKDLVLTVHVLQKLCEEITHAKWENTPLGEEVSLEVEVYGFLYRFQLIRNVKKPPTVSFGADDELMKRIYIAGVNVSAIRAHEVKVNSSLIHWEELQLAYGRKRVKLIRKMMEGNISCDFQLVVHPGAGLMSAIEMNGLENEEIDFLRGMMIEALSELSRSKPGIAFPPAAVFQIRIAGSDTLGSFSPRQSAYRVEVHPIAFLDKVLLKYALREGFDYACGTNGQQESNRRKVIERNREYFTHLSDEEKGVLLDDFSSKNQNGVDSGNVDKLIFSEALKVSSAAENSLRELLLEAKRNRLKRKADEENKLDLEVDELIERIFTIPKEMLPFVWSLICDDARLAGFHPGWFLDLGFREYTVLLNRIFDERFFSTWRIKIHENPFLTSIFGEDSLFKTDAGKVFTNWLWQTQRLLEHVVLNNKDLEVVFDLEDPTEKIDGAALAILMAASVNIRSQILRVLFEKIKQTRSTGIPRFVAPFLFQILEGYLIAIGSKETSSIRDVINRPLDQHLGWIRTACLVLSKIDSAAFEQLENAWRQGNIIRARREEEAKVGLPIIHMLTSLSLRHKVHIEHPMAIESYVQRLEGYYSSKVLDLVKNLLQGDIEVRVTGGGYKIQIDSRAVESLSKSQVRFLKRFIRKSLIGKRGLFKRQNFWSQPPPKGIEIKITIQVDTLGRIQFLPQTSQNTIEISPLAFLDQVLFQDVLRHEIDHALDVLSQTVEESETKAIENDRLFFESLDLEEQLKRLWLYSNKNPNGVDVKDASGKDVYPELERAFARRYGFAYASPTVRDNIWFFIKTYGQGQIDLNRALFSDKEQIITFRDFFYMAPAQALNLWLEIETGRKDKIDVLNELWGIFFNYKIAIPKFQRVKDSLVARFLTMKLDQAKTDNLEIILSSAEYSLLAQEIPDEILRVLIYSQGDHYIFRPTSFVRESSVRVYPSRPHPLMMSAA